MKKINQTGLAVLEGLLVVVAIFAIGTAAYFAYQNHGAKTVTSESKVPAAKTDPYKGWATYKSTINGLSFRYPANWSSDIKLEVQDTWKTDTGKLTAPDGFEFYVYNNPSGIGGGCSMEEQEDDGCPYVETYSAAPATVSGGSADTYLIKYYLATYPSRRDLGQKTIGLYTLYKGDYDVDAFVKIKEIRSFPPYLIFNKKGAKDDDTGRVWAYGAYPQTFTQSKLPADKYYALPNLIMAEQILKSMKFE
ncbi:MAG TPA: hypothetical protein VLF21_03465 [Candidatus Saccharimonadales bacterium]|nr:hypothetical protein [Candidatus Saccharimonadales bacterium]